MCLAAAFFLPLRERSGRRQPVAERSPWYLVRPVAPVAYQVILEPGIGQFLEFEPRRVYIRINSLGVFLVHKLTCGKRESVS